MATRRRRGGDGLLSTIMGNKDVTSSDGRYVHPGSGAPLQCFQCKGLVWAVNSFVLGGRFSEALDVNWITNNTYYAYTCENCSELRFKKNALVRGDRAA
jgi:predicted nucleic-acid-binding Zn-ribbon protein